MKNGWQRMPLEDAVFLQEGPGIRKYEYQEDGYPMINVRCVQDGYIDLSTRKAANVELANGKWKHFQVNEGDILFTISGSIGRTAIVEKQHLPLLMNTSVVRFRSKVSELRDDFFYYYLQSQDFLAELHSMSSGTAQKNVGPTHLKTMDVPIPPLPEQRRIVGILDEAFDGIATAKATAEKNLQNARALFECHLNAVFTLHGDGWVDMTLGEIADFKNGLNYNKNSDGQTLPVVGVGDFHSNYVVPIENLQSATIDGQLDDGYAIARNDILTVRSNGSKELVGRCMLVPDVEEVTSYSGFIIRVRFDTEKIAPRFLLHFMKSVTAGPGLCG